LQLWCPSDGRCDDERDDFPAFLPCRLRIRCKPEFRSQRRAASVEAKGEGQLTMRSPWEPAASTAAMPRGESVEELLEPDGYIGNVTPMTNEDLLTRLTPARSEQRHGDITRRRITAANRYSG
jgi:hypothetical protein